MRNTTWGAMLIGLGLVGQLTAQLARAQGCRVIALDLREDRVALARTLGADVGNPTPNRKANVPHAFCSTKMYTNHPIRSSTPVTSSRIFW